MYSVTHNTATFINKVLMSQAYVTVKLYLYSMADFFAPVYTSVSIAKACKWHSLQLWACGTSFDANSHYPGCDIKSVRPNFR